MKESIFNWKNMDREAKTNWCLKWFKITLMLISIQATTKIIETIILIRSLGTII